MSFQLKKVQSAILGSSNNENSDTKDRPWRKMNPKSVRMAEMQRKRSISNGTTKCLQSWFTFS